MAGFKLIHLSDTHLPPQGLELYGLRPAERLAQAVEAINTHHGDAGLVVVTGDLVHWGDETAYQQLSDILARLAPPVRLLIGNHDDRIRFRSFFPEQAVDDAGFIQGAVDLAPGRFIFLDTVIAGKSGGEICAARLDWLRGQLESAPGDCFLFAHHPPFDLGVAAMDRIRLVGADRLWDVLSPHRARIRHLFFGHIHRTISGSWRGLPWSTVKGMAHQVDLDLTPESLERGIIGTLEDPSFGMVLISDETVIVHAHDFTYEGPRFPLIAPAGGDQRTYAVTLRPAQDHLENKSYK